jgi:putative transposase
LLALFASRRSTARERYAKFVAEGIRAPSPWEQLKGQVFLGDDQFVEKMQKRAGRQQREDVQIPVAHRRPLPPTLPQIESRAANRNAAILRAHGTGAYSYQQIAVHFGVHFTTVGRIVREGR